MTRTRRGSVDDEEKVTAAVPQPVSTRRSKEVKETKTAGVIDDKKVGTDSADFDNESLQKYNLNELKAKATALSVKFAPSVKKQEIIAMLMESKTKTVVEAPLKRSGRSSNSNVAATTESSNIVAKEKLELSAKRGSSRINKASVAESEERAAVLTPGKRKAAEMQRNKSPSPDQTVKSDDKKKARETSPVTKSPPTKKKTVDASSSIDYAIVKTTKKAFGNKDSSSSAMDVDNVLTPHESSLVLAALSDPEMPSTAIDKSKKSTKSPKEKIGSSSSEKVVVPRDEKGLAGGVSGIHDLARNVILNYRDGTSVSEHEYLALKIFLDNVKPADKPSLIPTPKPFMKTTVADIRSDSKNNGLRQELLSSDSAIKQAPAVNSSFGMPPPSEIKASFDSAMKVDKRLSFGDSSWVRHRESFMASPSQASVRQDYQGVYPGTSRVLNQPFSMSVMPPPIMQTSRTPLSTFNPGSMINTMNTSVGFPLQPPQIALNSSSNNNNILGIGVFDSRKRQSGFLSNDQAAKRQPTVDFPDVRLALPMPASSPFVRDSFSYNENSFSGRSTFSEYTLPINHTPGPRGGSPSTLDLLAETSTARKKHLTFIEKRKLQRQSIGQAPPSVAKRILESIVDLKPPSEEMRRKPEAIDLLPSNTLQQKALTPSGAFESKSVTTGTTLGLGTSSLPDSRGLQSSSATAERRFEFLAASGNILQPSRPVSTFGTASQIQSSDKEFTFSAPTPIGGSDEADYSSAVSPNHSEIKYVFSPPNLRKKVSIEATPKAASSSLNTASASASTPAVASNPIFISSSGAKPVANIAASTSFTSSVDTKNGVGAVTAPAVTAALAGDSIWAKAARADTVKCPACMVPNERSAKKCVSCESDMAGPAHSKAPAAAPAVPSWASAAPTSVPSWAAAPATTTTTAKPPTSSSSAAPSVGFVFGAAPKSDDSAPPSAVFTGFSAPSLGGGPSSSGGFVFGGKLAESSKDKASPANAPLFGGFAQGNSATASTAGGFIFGGASSASSKAEPGKAEIVFDGSKDGSKTVEAKPSFGAVTFGLAPTTSSSFSSTFSFGSVDGKANEGGLASAPKSADAPAATGFSFGSNVPKVSSGGADVKSTGSASSAPAFTFGAASSTAGTTSSTPAFTFSSSVTQAAPAPVSAAAPTPSVVFSSASAPIAFAPLSAPAQLPVPARTLSIGSHGTDSPNSRMDMEHGDVEHHSTAVASTAPLSLPAFGASASSFSSSTTPASSTFSFSSAAKPFGSTAPDTYNLFSAPAASAAPAFGSSTAFGTSSLPTFGGPVVGSTASFGGPATSSSTFSFGTQQAFTSQASNSSSTPSFSFNAGAGAGIPTSSNGNIFGGAGMFSSGPPANSIDSSGNIGSALGAFLGGGQSSALSSSTLSTPFNSAGAFDIGKEDPKDRRKVKAKRRT